MEEEANSKSWTFILILVLIWSLFFHKQKYQGFTAEEWANKWEGMSEYYEEAQAEADDWEQQYEDLFNCVDSEEEQAYRQCI